jgi:biopolymer transport protein ExbB
MIGRALVGALVLVFSLPAAAWWNDDWGYRKPIGVDTTAAGADVTSPIADAAVLVRLHLGNFTYFADTLPKGEDIRFVAADDVTPLAYHIEGYDPSNQLAFIWVKLPDLTPSAKPQTFYMYYGNSKAPAGGDARATYDAHQVLDLHFTDGDAAPRDQTAYANNPTQFSAQRAPASLIAGGVGFDGTGSIRVPASASLRMDSANGWTFSTWLRLDAAQNSARILEVRDAANGVLAIGIADRTPYVEYTGAGGPQRFAAGAGLDLATWHHLAVVADATGTRIYVDGAVAGEQPGAMPALGGDITLGAATDGSAALTGVLLDEIQMANVARPVEAIRFAARSQGMGSTAVTYGEDTSREGGKTESYFVVTLRNVTADGWAVIGLLGVMAALSWFVMITKGLVIQRIRKDNMAFTKAFYAKGELADLYQPPTAEDEELESSPLAQAMSSDHSHFRSSSLYHLYVAGMRDVESRFAGSSVGAARAKVLESESINVIRASLDAANVRELQKLNNQMVILTLAISGGPFLGLLGTVVGVMITFAAIAASGDVNVNAIAPGIAAALVATVAGLGVAIPALFGYNYLGSRIKEITADNRVFLDEFIASVAETYAR